MNIKRKSANKTYDNFLVYVPVELARVSQFPFLPKDVVAIRVDPQRKRVVLERADERQRS